MWGPHQSLFIFAWINSINSITRNYGIESMLILKHFKKQKSCENCLLERKMTAKFYWKWDSWVILKILRMKDRMLWNDFKKRSYKTRIRTCLTGEVESPSSPIRCQAPDVKYLEKAERRPDRILDVRHPEKVEGRSDRIPDVRHPKKVECRPDKIPNVRHPDKGETINK